MRILTWNVNVLRTCLDYHPFSSMEKRNVEGLLDTLGAQIACFQEHKTRRAQLEKSYACPGPYDAFWTFPRSKTGYSGVCTFVDSRLCVPLKAEEGITGLLLDDKASTMKPPWKMEERLGCYPDHDEMRYLDEEGVAFDPKRLDMEGRAVVCDFGLFVLFNLYSPNETNETRRPYKMNFLACLQERVKLLLASGKEVIVVGDLNIMRAPIDSGEGGIRTSAAQHYEHPARVILNDWIAPRGPMIDVVRESWPERDDMFTCWNQKLDARPSNYGSRIDYVLCSEGLRPWIKGGDIDNKIFGSDHCPVYIDLHDEIDDPADPGHKLYLRDALNPPDRPPCTAPVYPQDPPRMAPEPPRFATKFYDEFSGRQRTLKSFFGGGAAAKKERDSVQVKEEQRARSMVAKSERGPMARYPEGPSVENNSASTGDGVPPTTADDPAILTTSAQTRSSVPPTSATPSTPFGIARAAFNHLDRPSTSNAEAGPSRPSINPARSPLPSKDSVRTQRRRSTTGASMVSVEIDNDDDVQYIPSSADRPGSVSRNSSSNGTADAPQGSASKAANSAKRQKTVDGHKNGSRSGNSAGKASQQSISSFFGAPKAKPSVQSGKFRDAQSDSTPRPAVPRDRSSSSTTVDFFDEPSDLPPPLSPALPSPRDPLPSTPHSTRENDPPDPERDAAIAAALAASEAEEEASRAAKKAEQAPIWNSLFAKKAAPLCTVHGKPCKVFTSKVVGPNKNKRFWLCSLPVGPGYDSGRSKRKREDVNPHFRCDFFLWDSANSRREAGPSTGSKRD